MKFTMNPSRAYLLGMWKSARTKEGVGVEGAREFCERFLKICFDEKLADPGKIKFEEGASYSKCYFYNTAVRAWLDSEMEKRDERLKYKNEFAASYFAGVFDATSGEANGIRYIRGDRVDEMVLLRLDFRVKKEKGKLALISPEFYRWILPYIKN